ncbi:MAG: hypothetical protein AAGB26_00705 [Planctomycetota bacterium]
MRAHTKEEPCPECGSHLRALRGLPDASAWLSWISILFPIVYIPVLGYIFLGLAFARSSFDPYMRISTVVIHIALIYIAYRSFHQLRQASMHKLWLRLWLSIALGLSPIFFYLSAIVLLIFVDTGILAIDLYAMQVGLILTLITLTGMIGSIVLVFRKPNQHRVLISFALPLHGFATGLTIYTALSHYHTF